jgi:hypothetical protein
MKIQVVARDVPASDGHKCRKRNGADTQEARLRKSIRRELRKALRQLFEEASRGN